jgi:peptidoglycan/LPS O-acetylase OafA/YrhL
MKDGRINEIPPPQRRFKALDGIRGIASVIVAFFWHYQLFFKKKPFGILGYWPYNFGWIMVDLFFILSGFIFFNTYGVKIRKQTLSIQDFVILRLSRLYPLHILTLFIIFLFVIFKRTNTNIYVFEEFDYSLTCLSLNLLMLQNGWLIIKESFNAPAWSLSIEIMMYLLFFYIFYYSKDGKKYLVQSLIVVYFGVIIYFSGLNSVFLNTQTARGLMGFFIGVTVGEAYQYLETVRHDKIGKFIIGLLLTGIVATTVPAIIWGYDILKNWRIVTTFVLFPSIIISVLIFNCLYKIFSIKPLLYLGELSYSIYLIHFPVFLIIKNIENYFHLIFDYSSLFYYLIYVIIVLIIAHISHFYFEKPLQNYIRKKLIVS